VSDSSLCPDLAAWWLLVVVATVALAVGNVDGFVLLAVGFGFIGAYVISILVPLIMSVTNTRIDTSEENELGTETLWELLGHEQIKEALLQFLSQQFAVEPIFFLEKVILIT
jgi:hypothetical protein